MKTLLKLPLLIAVAFVVAACGESPTEVVDSAPSFANGAANTVIGSATGSGHSPCATVPAEPFSFNCDPTNPEGALRTLSFNARMYADGSVSGRLQAKNRENGVEGKADVICIRFTRPNLAWIILDIPHAFGSEVTAMAVEDNGQGSAADPDRMTVFFGPRPDQAALVCDGSPQTDGFLNFLFDNPANSYDIVHGNVQVRAPAGY